LIDWIHIGENSLWVAGLAAALASLSWAAWLAARTGRRLRQAAIAPGIQACLHLGLAGVSAGLLLSAGAALERVLWLVFLSWFAARALQDVRARAPAVATTAQRPPAHPPTDVHPSSRPLHLAAEWVVRAELWLLLALAPFLMFPNRVTPWLVPLLALPWLARKLTQGHFSARTPMDGPILVLLLMLPVSLQASMDLQRSLPKLYGIILGIAVFYAIVNHVQRPSQAWHIGLAIALGGLAVSALALVGTEWPATGGVALPQAYRHLPRVISERAGSLSPGFNPNEVAAVLCLFNPFVASLLFLGSFGPARAPTASPATGGGTPMPWSARRGWLPGLLTLGLLVMLGMLILSQSRSALLGIVAALLVLASFRRRWLWPALLLALLAGALAWHYLGPEQIVNSILAVGAERNVRTRFEIWQRALYMIQDFSYTGVGLNTFSLTANVLYPFLSTTPQEVLQLTHAHNAFLQVAVDVGVPGLVAYLALLIGFGVAWWTAYRHFASGPLRALSVGLLCSMVAYHVYGLTDCITLGAKPGVAIWAMLGLMAALANRSEVTAA
jgi:putative inorganic carbon (HCO3(-)) transporter